MQVSNPCKQSVAIPVIWVILISSYLRVRRVKCDEESPYCLRCRRFGIECDGYLVSNKSGQGPAKCLIAPKREVHLPHQVIPTVYVQPREVFFESEQNLDSSMSSIRRPLTISDGASTRIYFGYPFPRLPCASGP
jgi:hypothetical protein